MTDFELRFTSICDMGLFALYCVVSKANIDICVIQEGKKVFHERVAKLNSSNSLFIWFSVKRSSTQVLSV